MRTSTNQLPSRLFCALLVAAAVAGTAPHAAAEVRREGAWPSNEEPVTLSVQGASRADAIRQLADKAGWSVVVQLPTGAAVDLHVKNEDASKVLGLLLGDGRYVAKRDGKLVDIRTDTLPVAGAAGEGAASDAGAPDASAAQPAPDETAQPEATAAPSTAETTAPSDAEAAEPEPPNRGDDRTVTGGDARIERHEVVHDLVVMGGEAEVLGRVTGDMAVMGGEAVIRSGARVDGDVSVIGGELTIEDGARVDGDVGVLGGEVVRGPDAGIGGKVTATGGAVRIGAVGHRDRHEDARDEPGLLARIGSAITHMALLFAFGAVMFGLAPRRMELMQTEMAARPGRVFALGVVGMLVGALVLAALCITVIGIPWAILAALLSVVAAYAGVCAVLAAAGAALARHRSASPYVHLAVGSVLLLVGGAVPFIGGALTAILAVLGVGVFVATRAAGLVPERRTAEPGAGPYRTAASI